MNKYRLLRWGNAHELIVTEDDEGRLTACLKVNKPNGNQELTITFAQSTTFEQVLAAWHEQNERWIELFVHDGRPFIAQRIIWLPHDLAIRWDVLHIDDKPFDSLSVLDMRKEDWPFGTFRVERIHA